jgi:DNA processing protein
MPGDLTERQAFLVLNALPGLGPIALNCLLDAFGGDPRAALAGDRRRLQEAAGVRPEAAAAIREWRGHFDPEKEEARMEKSGVAFLTRADPGYPRLLREIHDPPVGLYRRGPYAFGHPCVAIVGTRRATLYGQGVAKRLGAELAGGGFCVVSGLARGIDTAAHEGALSAGGRTAAVLGTGIDIIYPPENLDLYRRIADKGAILSEFPFGRPADRDSFPMRSRILSGICEAVVVVESDLRGGAMATARFAGEHGRLLFAVPGRVDQSTSAGCNQLIRDGATLLTGAGDILAEMQYLGGLRPAPPGRGSLPAQAEGPAGLGPDEERVLHCFLAGSSQGPGELAEQTGLTDAGIRVALAILETKGFVSKRADGAYEGRGTGRED